MYYMYIGTNHGIEIFEDNIEFAEERLKEFKEESPWLVEILIYSLTDVLFSPSPLPPSLPPYPTQLLFPSPFHNRYDPADFCEPHFIAGNALLLSPSGILYDRIYCGAACPSEHVQLLKNLLKIDGILVMPCENCVRRERGRKGGREGRREGGRGG